MFSQMNGYFPKKKGNLAVAALSTLSLLMVNNRAEAQTNILYIMTDQQNLDMIQALQLGSGKYANTPNLDRLVKSGYTFTRNYVASPLSVPSRFSLLTGQSPAQFGVESNDVDPALNDKIVPYVTQFAMGHLMRQGGFNTYYGGKVHLPFAQGKKNRNQTEKYGFEFIEESAREPLAQTAANFIKSYQNSKPFFLFLSFINPHDICTESWQTVRSDERNKKTRIANKREGKKEEEIIETLLPLREQYTQMGLDVFKDDKLSNLPRNLGPMSDNPVSEKIADLTRNISLPEWRRYRWVYFRLVEKVDAQIGQVLDALASSKYSGNTVVIFTSDHGEMGGSHGMRGKNYQFEECQRVPLVFAGKGIIHGRDDQTLVCNGYDLLPTLCEMAGVRSSKGFPEYKDNQYQRELRLNGQSLWSQVQGKGHTQQRDYLFLECSKSFQIVTKEGYKLTKYKEKSKGTIYTFVNLNEDPYELKNSYKGWTGSTQQQKCMTWLESSLSERNIPN